MWNGKSGLSCRSGLSIGGYSIEVSMACYSETLACVEGWPVSRGGMCTYWWNTVNFNNTTYVTFKINVYNEVFYLVLNLESI